jgi:hypothetical protein
LSDYYSHWQNQIPEIARCALLFTFTISVLIIFEAAWVPFFDSINAIIFLAPISAFDQTLAEDKHANRLVRQIFSLHPFTSSCGLHKIGRQRILVEGDLFE